MPNTVCAPTTSVCVSGIGGTFYEAARVATETAATAQATAIATADNARREAEAAIAPAAPYVQLVSDTVSGLPTVGEVYNTALDQADSVCSPVNLGQPVCVTGLGSTVREAADQCSSDPADPRYIVWQCP